MCTTQNRKGCGKNASVKTGERRKRETPKAVWAREGVDKKAKRFQGVLQSIYRIKEKVNTTEKKGKKRESSDELLVMNMGEEGGQSYSWEFGLRLKEVTNTFLSKNRSTAERGGSLYNRADLTKG